MLKRFLGITPVLLTFLACGDATPGAPSDPSGLAPDVDMDESPSDVADDTPEPGPTDDGGTAPAPEATWICQYENPFSGSPECRGYLGEAWTEAEVEDNCSKPYTGVVGELSVGVCATDGTIGTCTEDPGGPKLLVTWIYDGDPEITAGACEGFAGGVWSSDGSVPGGMAAVDGEVMQQGIDAMASDDEVAVVPADCADGSCLQALVDASGSIDFRPAGQQVDAGFIFYPGANVDPRAYAPAARAIARQGFLVSIVPMPGLLAFNGIERADSVIAAHPEITRWFVGGHSMGGVSASSYTQDHSDKLAGLIVWGTFPAETDDLSAVTIPVTSIYGEIDALSTVQEIEATAYVYPADTLYVGIPGGNHYQFGYYGEQEGDVEAWIDRESQQSMVVAATVHAMNSALAGGATVHPAFAQASALEASWCQQAQRIVANIDASVLTDAMLDNEVLQQSRPYGESKAAVDGSAARPVSIRTQVQFGGNARLLQAPSVLSTEVWCKLKNQESIVQELGLATVGAPQTCAEVNQAALDWALDQLTPEQQAAFNANMAVTFAPDDAQLTGVEWLTLSSFSLVESGGTLQVTSSSLPVSLDADAGEAFVGVHYCKLWSPVDALRFALSRQ